MCADGPCLVETGARLHGLKGPKLTEFATGLGTHELVVDVVLNGGRIFQQLHARNYRYVVRKWVFETMILNFHKEGILMSSLDTPELRQLPSIVDIFPTVHPGQELKITRDLNTSAGLILQAHASEQQCFKDVEVLRSLEAGELFQVKAGVAPRKGSSNFSADMLAKMSPARISGQTSPYQMSPVMAPSASPQMKGRANSNVEIDNFELVGLDINE